MCPSLLACASPISFISVREVRSMDVGLVPRSRAINSGSFSVTYQNCSRNKKKERESERGREMQGERDIRTLAYVLYRVVILLIVYRNVAVNYAQIYLCCYYSSREKSLTEAHTELSIVSGLVSECVRENRARLRTAVLFTILLKVGYRISFADWSASLTTGQKVAVN